MSPYQHGEVYVTDDGAETDLDLGHYERFTGVSARQSDNVTAGRIYQTIITRERRGDYLGATVRSEEHTSELQSLMRISYAVFCLKKKKILIQTCTLPHYTSQHIHHTPHPPTHLPPPLTPP